MKINDLKNFFKSKNFSNYQALSKKELLLLKEYFDETGKIPVKYMKKKRINESCKENNECRTNKCQNNRCVYNNDMKSKNFKPLEVVKKFELTEQDQNPEKCYDVPNLEIKQHQKNVIEFLRDTKRKGLLVVHRVGSGKTITAIISAKCILSKYPNYKVVVLTPSSVVQQFKQEIFKLNLTPEMYSRYDVYSHQTWLDRFEANQVSAKNTILIIDEAHKFKGRYMKKNNKEFGKYSRILSEASKESKKIILLSATPLENGIKEIQNYMAMINNTLLKEEYKKSDNLLENKNVTFLKNDYRNYLKCKVSVYNEIDKTHFPQKRIKNVRLFMTKEYQKKYMEVETENIENDAVAKIFMKNDDIPSLKQFYTGIRRAINKITVPSPKIKWTLGKIDEHVKNNKKLLIYSTWLDFGVNIIESKLEEQKIPYAIIKGATSKEERFDIVKQYNKDKINVLLITSAGAEGLDLKKTRSVIILEPFWHTSRIQQVIGRAVRYKSHETLPESERYVDVYNLLLEKNEKYPDESGLDSADMLLYKKSINKHSVIKQFTNQMIESSIELNKC